MKKILAPAILLSLSFSHLKADYWTQKASFFYSGYGNAGFAVGNTGYVGTGEYTNGPLNIFRAYNPITNSWTSKAVFAGDTRVRGTGIN